MRKAITVTLILTVLMLMAGCGSKKNIIAQGSCGEDGDNAVFVLDEDGSMVISGSGTVSKQFGQEEFAGSIVSVTFEEGIEVIGDQCLALCPALEKITVPSTVEYTGWGAFRGCPKLKDVQIAEGLGMIDAETFKDCTALENINIPKSVMSLGIYAFEGCTSLKTVTLAEGSKLRVMESCVFKNCSSLTSFTISRYVSYVGGEVFTGCSSLADVYIYLDPEKIDWDSREGASFGSGTVIHVDPQYYNSFVEKFASYLHVASIEPVEEN